MKSAIALRLVLALALPMAVAITASADTVAEKAQVCAACHGENGMPTNPDAPIIWGQNEGYIYIELRDFNSGLRKSEQMQPIASGLSRDDMKALAHYFTKKPWPRTQYKASAEDIKIG